MIRPYKIDSMMHLVGIYDTTTIVQFECQARGDLSQNTLPSSSSSSSELKQSILVLDTLPISQVKNAPGIYPSSSSSFFDPPSTIHGKRRQGRVIRGLAYLKTIPIWGCQQNKSSSRKRMADLQLLCSLHTVPYCCCSFFQVCTLRRFF